MGGKRKTRKQGGLYWKEIEPRRDSCGHDELLRKVKCIPRKINVYLRCKRLSRANSSIPGTKVKREKKPKGNTIRRSTWLRLIAVICFVFVITRARVLISYVRGDEGSVGS